MNRRIRQMANFALYGTEHATMDAGEKRKQIEIWICATLFAVVMIGFTWISLEVLRSAAELGNQIAVHLDKDAQP